MSFDLFIVLFPNSSIFLIGIIKSSYWQILNLFNELLFLVYLGQLYNYLMNYKIYFHRYHCLIHLKLLQIFICLLRI